MPTFPTLTDVEVWTDDALSTLLGAVHDEVTRRYTLRSAEDKAAQNARRWREASDAGLPPLAAGQHRAWAQPQGAHDAYPKGYVVQHKGKVYESQHPANVWEPGTVAGLWKDVTGSAPDPAPAPTGPEWKAGEAVKVGDVRLYKGVAYRVLTAHTTADHWTPDAAPSLWTKAL